MNETEVNLAVKRRIADTSVQFVKVVAHLGGSDVDLDTVAATLPIQVRTEPHRNSPEDVSPRA